MANRFTTFLGNIFGNNSGAKETSKNIGNTSMRIPLERMVQSVEHWRQGVLEAEYYIPFRVKQQQLYNDLQDEPHIAACMERRMDLTLLRDYTVDCGNEQDTDTWTKWLKAQAWFIDYQRYVLLAKFRGYCLVSMGDIVSNESMTNGLPQLKMLEHSQVSPDRKNFAGVVYGVEGVQWEEEPYKDWHIYISTPPETGNGACGYGLLHKVAVPGIFLRTTIIDNANYNERFGLPVTWGSTDKEGAEREFFFDSLKAMGSTTTFVTDSNDKIEFINAAAGASAGYRTFADLEMRCQKLVSKNILGHADVMDSIPKRSGSDEGSYLRTPTTPVQAALSDIASKDGKYVQPYVNQLLHKMRMHGVGLPANANFKYNNDDEEEIVREKEYQSKLAYATIAKTMHDAGLQMDAADFVKETGIQCKSEAGSEG